MLSGKSVAVTGAAQGIGKATALACAKLGARVTVCDLNGRLAESVADSINASGGQAIALEMNASQRPDCNRMVIRAVNTFGTLDGLVCGGMKRFYEPAETFSDE